MSFKLICLWAGLLWTVVSGSRLRRMDEKVKLLESRQRQESISRLEDVSRLSHRLDSIEMQLNTSQIQCCSDENSMEIKSYEQEIPDTPTVRDTLLLEAFKDEKQENSRWRQKVSEIDELVNNVSRVYSSIRHEIDTVNGDSERAEEECHAKYVTLSETLEESIKHLSNQIKAIENKFKSNFDNLRDLIINKTETFADTHDNVDLIAKHQSCLGIYQSDVRENGVYKIYPTDKGKPVEVFCDMTTDGGGWTVFQRRRDGSVDFYRDWEDYKQGFGDVNDEFWLGNDYIAALTNVCCHELRIELEDFDGDTRHAKYNRFQVLPESDNYTLVVGSYSGDAGDSLWYHDNLQFSTKDRDNDKFPSNNCATMRRSAWWYKACNHSNLNGLYFQDSNANATGVIWGKWRGYSYSMKKTDMKLR